MLSPCCLKYTVWWCQTNGIPIKYKLTIYCKLSTQIDSAYQHTNIYKWDKCHLNNDSIEYIKNNSTIKCVSHLSLHITVYMPYTQHFAQTKNASYIQMNRSFQKIASHISMCRFKCKKWEIIKGSAKCYQKLHFKLIVWLIIVRVYSESSFFSFWNRLTLSDYLCDPLTLCV